MVLLLQINNITFQKIENPEKMRTSQKLAKIFTKNYCFFSKSWLFYKLRKIQASCITKL